MQLRGSMWPDPEGSKRRNSKPQNPLKPLEAEWRDPKPVLSRNPEQLNNPCLDSPLPTVEEVHLLQKPRRRRSQEHLARLSSGSKVEKGFLSGDTEMF